MRTFRDFLNKRLKDESFCREYEAIRPEMDIIRAILEAWKPKHITQKELATRTGINQADISKLEKGIATRS